MSVLNHSFLIDRERDIRYQFLYRRRQEFSIEKSCAYRDHGIKSGIYFLLGEFVVSGESILLVKVGHTKDIRRRLSEFYGAGPTTLYLIHFEPHFSVKRSELQTIENQYHSQFKKYKMSREWFHFKPVSEIMGWPYEDFFTKE